MLKIGDKKLVYSTSFLVADNQEAAMDVTFSDNSIQKMSIVFNPAGYDPQDYDGNGGWRVENGVVKFRFFNWRNGTGIAMKEPLKFGDVEGKKIFFQIAHYMVGETNFAHFFIYAEE